MAGDVFASGNPQRSMSQENPVGLVLARGWWIIALAAIAAAVAVGAVSWVQERPFVARSSVVIGQGGGGLRPESADAINALSGTIRDLLRSERVAADVARVQRVPGGADRVLANLRATTSDRSAVVVATYRDRDEALAVRILGEVNRVFLRAVNQRLRLAGSATDARPQPDALTVSVLDPPRSTGRAPRELVGPLAVGLVIGLAAGVLLAAAAAWLRSGLARRRHRRA